MPAAEGNRTMTNHAVRNGREIISYSDCTSYTGKLDRLTNQPLTDWTPVETAIDDNLKASAFRNQPPPLRRVAEVMHFEHATGVDKLSSPDFALHQVLNKDLSAAQLATVDAIAREEKPPSAPNRAAVMEHCQGWTLRVVRRLVDERIVEARLIGVLEGCMDPTQT
ncbi:hypothetical protein L209DRAFT_777406 [Thermothelomyces heterothallicus CBS 203.75]